MDMTTQAPLDSLFDSLQRNKEFELNQICDLSHSEDNGPTDALRLLSKPDLTEHVRDAFIRHIHVHIYIYTSIYSTY